MVLISRWKLILSVATLLVLFGIAGAADYEDALAAEADYCDRLSAGVHKDYDNLRNTCSERYWSK